MKSLYKYKFPLMIGFSFIIYSVLSSIILLHTHVLFSAADMQFNIKRFMEFRQSISHFNFFPIFSFNYFHGSSIMSMYPFLGLLPFVLISFYVPFITSYYIFFSFIIFISLVIGYFSSLNFSKSKLVSYIFTMVYTMSLPFLMYMFANGDLGAVTSLPFLPLVVFGFIDIINGYTNCLKLILGFLFISFCHVPTFAILFLFVGIWSLINIKNFNKKIFLSLVRSFILIVVITSIIWMPLIKIILLNNINSVKFVQLSGITVKEFIKYMSIFAILSVPISIFYYKKFNNINKQLFVISVLILLFSSKLMPWKIITSVKPFNLINQFQFTYRFLIIPNILLSYLFAFCFVSFLLNNRLKKIVYLLFIIIVVILQLLDQSFILHRKLDKPNEYLNSYRKTKIAKTNDYIILNNKWVKYVSNGYLSNNDYYPKEALGREKYINNKLITNINNGNIIKLNRIGYNKFQFYNKSRKMNVVLPIIHYNGLSVKLYLNGKLIHPHYYKGSFVVDNIKHGKNVINIKYNLIGDLINF